MVRLGRLRCGMAGTVPVWRYMARSTGTWSDTVRCGRAVQGEAWLELARPDRFRRGGTWYDKAQQGRLSIGVDGDMEWRYMVRST